MPCQVPSAESARRDRHMQGNAVEHGFDMGRHIVRTFHIMHPAGIRRRQAIERRNQIGTDVGVGIFLDYERGRGVLEIKQYDAVLRTDLLQKLRNIAGDLEKALAGGRHRQNGGSDGLDAGALYRR